MKLVYHILVLLLLKYSTACFGGVKKETTVVTLPNDKGEITYNFYCFKDNKDGCEIMKYNINGAFNMLLSYFGKYASPCSFDFIVDDFSSIKTTVDMPVVPLNTNFEPLIPEIKKVFDMYPNYKALEKKIYKNSNRNVDFLLVANKLKNEEDHYEEMLIHHQSVILEGIIYGMVDPSLRAKVLSYITYNRDYYAPPGWATEQHTNTLLDKGEGALSTEKKNLKRIIAIGDVHGDYNKFVEILTHAKLIDKKKNWIGTDAILVQTGDLHEKGNYSKEILDLLLSIRKQAKSKGGEVDLILGNHDLNTISGYFDCTYLIDMFKSGNPEKRRQDYSLKSKYGRLLRQEMDIVKVVDGMIFVHGGLTSQFAALGIDNINERAHEIFTKAKYTDYLLDTDPILTDDGPLLTRFFSQNEDTEAVCEELDKVLKMTNTTRMIVGHTPQENGKINTLCNNKLIMIDIGLTGYYGSRFGYLEIKRDSNEFWAIYN